MTKKTSFVYVAILASMLALSINPVLAKNDKNTPDQDIPEQDGVYSVSGHPELKVKVIVHKEKSGAKSSNSSIVCGLKDYDSLAVVHPAGWHLPANWTYTLNLSGVPASVGAQNLATIADNSFDAWTAAAGQKVAISQSGTFTTVNKAVYDGQNIIAWGRISSSAIAITYTWYYPSSGLVAETDTIMNQKYLWRWTPYSAQNICFDRNAYDAQDILTHELGHWYGLSDEYTAAYMNNTMYGYGAKGEIKKDTLASGDVIAAMRIYQSY
jgi:hypothetical protein